MRAASDQTADSNYKFKDFMGLISRVTRRKGLFLVGILLSVLSSGATLLVPQLTKGLIDTSKLAQIDKKMLGILLAAFAAQLALGTLSSFLLRYAGEATVKALREELWNHLLLLPVNYYDEHKSGEITSRLVNDTGVVTNLVAQQFPATVSGLLQLVGALIILFLMDWQMAAMIFIGVPLVVIIMMPIGKIMAKLGRQLQKATADFSGDVTEKLSEIRLIKASNGEDFERNRGQEHLQQIFGISIKDAKVSAFLQPIMMTAMLGMFVGLLGYGAIRVQAGTMTSGSLVAFLLYLVNVISPVATFAMLFAQVQRAMGATERIDQILREPVENQESGAELAIDGLPIKALNLSFSYETGRPVLTDVSFEALPNTVVAFAGPSGSGKSTIFSLLEGFYQPDNGVIMVGDQPLASIRLSSWRSQIGYVSQDSAVLAGTIRDNLNYGLPRALPDERLWEGLRMAFADHFVREFPEQLDTQIGERGVKLSGGQKQRLAIARAFLRNPRILMLDEATASLDSQSEEQVQRALEELMKDRTTFVIAHRLATIVNADRIYFVEQGQITGAGTHQELLKDHPLYREYVQEQLLEN